MTVRDSNKLIEYWRKLSEYDLATAEAMFKTKRYPYCLFVCHLSIEKILKALIVKETRDYAPYTHNLVDLAKKLKIGFSNDDQELLSDLTEFNLEARYPEWKKEFYKRATKRYTEPYLKRTIKLQKWLKNYLKK